MLHFLEMNLDLMMMSDVNSVDIGSGFPNLSVNWRVLSMSHSVKFPTSANWLTLINSALGLVSLRMVSLSLSRVKLELMIRKGLIFMKFSMILNR